MLETEYQGRFVRIALKSGERIHSTFSGYEPNGPDGAEERLDNQEPSWWRAKKPIGTAFVDREYWGRYAAHEYRPDGTCELREDLDELYIVVPVDVWRKYGLNEPEVNELGECAL